MIVMKKIAHIIHPVIVEPPSDLVTAQPITIETMKTAKEFVEKNENVKIDLIAIQYHDEARLGLPECFRRTPDLKRSVCDVKTFEEYRKLALIKDIFDSLYKEAPDADYLIYTNADIGVVPNFYSTILKIIGENYDSFVINRRSISNTYSSLNDIPLMYAEVGTRHPGYDCFVLKRDLYPKFELGKICVGTAWIGRCILANLVSYADKFIEIQDFHLTFHLGDSLTWREPVFNEYLENNLNEYREIFNKLESLNGRFDPVLRSYLLDSGKDRIIPDFKI